MLPLSRLALECGQSAESTWQSVAELASGWAAANGRALRDCIVLVPFAQLLAPARAAFARRPGWMPRVETSRTLARALGPEPPVGLHGPSFDAAVDSLALQQLLGRQAWGRAWRQRDPVGFDAGIAHLVRTGHELARAAFDREPGARALYWAKVREVLSPLEGPGAQDRRLARVAAEWAALAQAPGTDHLFALSPAGWIAIRTGSQDALVMNLLEHAARRGVPSLMIEAQAVVARREPHIAEPGTSTPRQASLGQFVCADFEHEAQTAAAQILRMLEAQVWPVALIAQDRVLVRRIRALLDRESVSISDETGWKLSTTRAAAAVVTLLRAARSGASSDDWLDWLKTGLQWSDLPGPDAAVALRSLEDKARRQRLVMATELAAAAHAPGERSLVNRIRHVLAPLTQWSQGLRGEWLAALGAALRSCGVHQSLSQDDAGRDVLQALRINDVPDPGDATFDAGDPMSLFDFMRWVDLALESRTFRPREDVRFGPAQVIITPLAQATLRPFAAAVLPGADARRLGAPPPSHPLLSNAQLIELGLTGADETRAEELAAFEHLLAQSPVIVSRRLQDEGAPLGASPIVEQAVLRLRRGGGLVAAPADPRVCTEVRRSPTRRSAPCAPALVPRRLSASGFAALRDCPYRFYARSMLRLREPEEIERDLEKRDYGLWLHEVLNRFHAQRIGARSAHVDETNLGTLAEEWVATLRLQPAEFLPFLASFRALVPRYVRWLHERDAQGWRWAEGEFRVELDLPEPVGLTLEGQIDRIDVAATADAEAMQLIDYKTGSLEGLRRRVSEPLEDTQLAFYAALLSARFGRVPQAGYLALDSKRIEWVEHRNVARSAAELIRGLGSEVQRLREGAPLPALGEGETCEHCEMRGLCRRDDWVAACGGST